MISVGEMKRTPGRLRHGALSGHLEIHDLDLVLDKGAADLAVLPAHTLSFLNLVPSRSRKQTGSPIAERIGDGCGAIGREAIKLGSRAIDVAGMEETHETVVGAVDQAPDQRRRCASNEGSRNFATLAHDLHVVIGEAEGRQFSGLRRNKPTSASACQQRRQAPCPELYQTIDMASPGPAGTGFAAAGRASSRPEATKPPLAERAGAEYAGQYSPASMIVVRVLDVIYGLDGSGEP